MAIPVVMPRQGQSVESCVITQWFKSKGDQVSEGDLLYAYETDKAAFEAEAPASGILLELFFQEGDEVPVLTNVAVIGNAGEDYAGLIPGQVKAALSDDSTDATEAMTAAPVAAPEVMTAEDAPPDADAPSGKKIRISPLARRIAQERQVDISSIRGSGPRGRIIERDVRSAPNLTKQQGSTPGAGLREAPHTTDKPSKTSPAPYVITTDTLGKTGFTDAPLSNIRKIIASRMLASLQSSAQLTHHISADARAMLSLRMKVKENAGKPGTTDITINDMVCFAVVRALGKHPEMNAHFLDNAFRTFHNVHLGFAVDTDRGLMVPVLQNADQLNLQGLAARLKTLATECRQGSINPELLSSEAASFTISNLGAFGIEMFTPVLNIPQVGILGINTITHRPADLGNGTIGFIPVIGLSLTYDHRAVDGAPASRFLKEVKHQIETIPLT